MKSSKRPDKRHKLQPLISRSRTAHIIGVCARTLKRYERRGLLTAHVMNSRLTCYPENEVLTLIANARAAGATQPEATA